MSWAASRRPRFLLAMLALQCRLVDRARPEHFEDSAVLDVADELTVTLRERIAGSRRR